MDINFNGFNEQVITFKADDLVFEGCLVKMKESGVVTKATEDGEFLGVCLIARDGYASVQVEGYVEIDLTGEVDVGEVALCATTSGVKAAEAGKTYRVLFVGTDTVGFLL